MIRKPTIILFSTLLLFSFAALSSACSSGPATDQQPLLEGTFPVDPQFREFYNELGGVEMLGPAISPLHTYNHYRIQFSVAALLIYNTQAETSSRFSLAPLGLELGVAEPHVSPPDDQTIPYVGGHAIHPEFFPLFRELGGGKFVGAPITEKHYNPEEERLEQYFENLGFYIPDKDPQRNVYLMSYGAFKCGNYCDYPTHSSANPSTQTPLPEPFASAVARLGPTFTGRAISPEYNALDGNKEIIFDNLVLYANPSVPDRVFARPVLELLGITPHPLAKRLDNLQLEFYPIEGDLGHNVPVIFADYIAKHGGLDISGPPITELFIYNESEEIYRQCFTNLCLDYHGQQTVSDLKIQPANLGIPYKGNYYARIVEKEFISSQSLENLTIKVWETKPVITSAEVQEIFVAIFQASKPVEGLNPELTLTYPDGREEFFFFRPTGPDGTSSMNIPPIAAPNGKIIPYEVCLLNLLDEQSCIGDSYLIWGNP
jgi:hypothetical protein